MDNYFLYFANKGHHPNKETILALEKELIFETFNDLMIHDIMKMAMDLALENYHRNIGIRINYKGSI